MLYWICVEFLEKIWKGNKHMKTSDILILLGGLALFLYGMHMMSDGLEAAAGNRMKRILEKLTANRFLGIAVGAGITAVIQSSSATTVMVVGFVNSRLMTLRQAVWIIMGANIGTTITGQLIALDISAIAPLIAFIGVSMVVFLKGEKNHHFGAIIAGLGVLFIGMGMMSDAMMPLRDSQGFIHLMTQFSNPLLGILAGALFTAVIQSSSASVGILQALASSGLIGLSSSVYVLFGQNIGTCITAVLASIGTNRNAKRTTIIHLLFNTIGTGIFVCVCMMTPFTSFMQSLTPDNPAAQIANVHTLFNIVTTLLLLPFGNYLAALSEKLLPDKGEAEEGGHSLMYLHTLPHAGDYKIGWAALAVSQLQQEVYRMFQFARENVLLSFESVEHRSTKKMAQVLSNEEYLDYLNMEISRYISTLMAQEMSHKDSKIINGYFKIVGNIERVGDHAMNIAEYAEMLCDKDLKFSSTAIQEIQSMKAVCLTTLDQLAPQKSVSPLHILEQVAKYEQQIDDINAQYRQNQIIRMQNGTCLAETSILYSEMLTDFERIGDHALNIAKEYTTMWEGESKEMGIAATENL